MTNLTGQSIGRYHIIEQLGEGGMATVYKAYDTRLERNVAIKVLRTEVFSPVLLEQVLQRFEREAKSLAKLSHPGIVNVLDFGEFESMPYLVMEYLPGGTLKQKLGKAMPWQDAIRILIPIAEGLAYAHQHGIIHRDIKPANILINGNGAPILTDFGIAKLLETSEGQTLTASGVGIGTPEYMAPEQGMGSKNIDARADIYALGIMLYEMVTGRKPYTADTPLAVVLKQINDPLPRPQSFNIFLSEELENILFKALAKTPEERYQSMDEVISAFQKLLQTPPQPSAPTLISPPQDTSLADRTLQAATIVDPTTRTHSEQPKPKRSRGIWIIASIMVLGVVALGAMAVGWWIFSGPTSTSPQPTAPQEIIVTKESTSTRPNATKTPTRLPSQTPTRRPPTATSIPIPKMEAWKDGDTADKISDLVENPNTNTGAFIVTVQPNQAVRFSWGWCTTTEAILEQNLKYLKYNFYVDNVNVTSSMAQIRSRATQESINNWYCNSYIGIIKSWPPGKHTIKYEMTTTQKVNDGQSDFEGTNTITYIITVAP